MKKLAIRLMTTAACLISSSAAFAADDNLKVVWGGGDPSVSTYSGTYVPMAINNLTDARLAGYVWGGKSSGSIENMINVDSNPTHLAVVQDDMARAEANKSIYNYTVIRDDLGFECYYAVTGFPGYDNFGHILGNAFDITIHTTGSTSGSMGSLKRLQEIFPDLQDVNVVEHGNDLEAVEASKADVAKGQASVAFFVKRPDPNNTTFEYIAENEMTFIPVVDFELEGKGLTFPDLVVENAGWKALTGGKPKRVTTACTKIALITGDPAALPADVSNGVKRRLEETIKRLGEQPTAKWQPQEAWFADMINNMSETGPDKLKALMEKAKNTASEIGEGVAKKINQ